MLVPRRVTICTQAVRPPVPGLTEVREAMRLQDDKRKRAEGRTVETQHLCCHLKAFLYLLREEIGLVCRVLRMPIGS